MNAGLAPSGPSGNPCPTTIRVVLSNGVTRHPASELQNLIQVTDVVESILQEIAASAASALGGSLSAGVTISCEGRPVTVASSDPPAAQFDEVQYSQVEGPCLTAMRTGSSLPLPLNGTDRTVGALNLSAWHIGGFGVVEQADAHLFAGDIS